MSVADLRKLHSLHQIDHQIALIRSRAANLDPGKEIQAKIARKKAQSEPLMAEHKRLTSDQLDLELRQKGIAQKVAKLQKELFGGTVVNPREVEAIEKELANLKRQSGELDDEILEILEKLPGIKTAVDAASKELDGLQAELSEHRKNIVQLKGELEANFKELMRRRPAALEGIPESLLAKYEHIRQRHGGIGMTDVGKGGKCELCGTGLPTKLIVGAKDGKVVTCESCHRIIYATDGLI